MLAQSLQELKQQVALRERYDNFIGGKWVPPVKGQYFDNVSPITGKPFCQVARSTAEDIELALDAAHAAREAWGNTAPAQRAPPAEQDRRPDRRQARPARARRNDRQRQADPRDDRRRRAARHRPFPLFRRLPPRAGRRHRPKSTTTRSPIISMSRSASSARSFRGTSRC